MALCPTVTWFPIIAGSTGEVSDGAVALDVRAVSDYNFIVISPEYRISD